MAFTSISEWSTTAASNTEINGISLAEGVMLPSAVNNSFRESMAQVAAYTRKGSDLATASTLNLDSIDSLWLNLTGTTTVTAVTLTSGHVRMCRAVAAFTLTASASLIVNGSASVNYTTSTDDLLWFEGYGSGVVRVWAVSSSSANLTSWASVTRASGFDTFVATPSSANLISLVTDETGTGALVFANTPTLVTPNIGAATGTSLTLGGAAVPTISSTSTLTNKTLTDPVITGAITEDIYTITDGAGFEIDPSNGSIQFVTLGASRTPAATNFQNGESVTLRIADGTAYTITWTTVGVVWKGATAPTLATSGYTEVHLEKSGNVIRGVHVGDFAS